MRAIKISSIFLLAALVATAEKPGRQGTTFVSNSMGFANGITAKATIAVEPPAPLSVFDNKSFSILTTTGNEYHRVIEDDAQHAYFGYDLSTERIPNTDQIRVAIAPLSVTVEQLDARPGAKAVSGFRFLVLPRYPPPLIVQNGDTIALDLLVSADGKLRIVDYIEISYKPAPNPKR